MNEIVQFEDILSPIEWKNVFSLSQPVHIDLGAGDGGFAVALAQQNSHINVLAVERLKGRAEKIAKKIKHFHLENLRVLRLETSYFLSYLVPSNSVAVIHVMHPDPWPKRKQQKNRLFQSDFIFHCARVLETGGELRLTLDHPGYFLEIIRVMKTSHDFEGCFWKPDPNYPKSDFEKQFLDEGKVVIRQAWRKSC
ncbi:MAG: tRNA (guanosine(46)-N7)-methyltransferase TrmB [Verrucomicrobiae bacterium]|nr:tRNA (guanosine(46)-N7)-methyltransferase TrmB [Verrucomicrobiae bacterium]